MTYAVVWNDLKGPTNMNPHEKGGFDTEAAAIDFAQCLDDYKTRLIGLLKDGEPILEGKAFQARVKLAGPADRGR